MVCDPFDSAITSTGALEGSSSLVVKVTIDDGIPWPTSLTAVMIAAYFCPGKRSLSVNEV